VFSEVGWVMATDGGVGSYVIVMRAVPVRPTPSVAVTVIVFTPGASGGEAVQFAVVPVVGPDVGSTAASVDQVTLTTPTSSDEMPARAAGAVPVANVSPVVGVMMLTKGAAGS